MAEGSKISADVVSAMAEAVSPADPLFGRRIEFHLERKQYSPISSAGSQNFHLETLNPSTSNHYQRSTAMGSTGPAAAALQSGRKSDGRLDPVLSFRITFRRIGAGLQNLGNTCYLNSVLQCLTYTEPLAAYCQSGEHKSSCRAAGFCAMCALQNHVMVALQSTGKILSPSHLVKNLRCISRNFRNSRQEDAHEYMVNLLESMHKCCLPSGVPTESPSAYEKSLVYRIFGGRLRSQVKCTQCHYCSNKFDPFLDLSLEILKADSLRKALSHFTAMEQLDGGERQYQCQRCKEKVRAYKQLTVHKAPYVLTIHLKRFGPDIPGQKIDKKVDFEPILDLKPFVSDQHEPDLKYTLYGVLVHAGWSTHSGHYYCYVRTSSGMWHSLDDNQVRSVSEKTVLAQRAYMLFYVRDTTSVIKRSVDAGRKNNTLASAPGGKTISHRASILNGAIQNAVCISEGSIAISKADGVSQGRPISVVGNSSGPPLPIDAKNGHSIFKDFPPVENNGHAPSRQATSLHTNDEGLCNGLRQTALSKDSTILVNLLGKPLLAATSSDSQKGIKDVADPSHLTGNDVTMTCHLTDNCVTMTSHVNVASVSCENGHVNGKVEARIFAAQPVSPGLSNLAPEENSRNLVKMNNLHNNDGITSAVSQNNKIPCSMDAPSKSIDKENEYVEKESTKPAEHQRTIAQSDKCTSNIRYQSGGREAILKVEESGLDTSTRMRNGGLQHETVVSKEQEDSVGKFPQAESKQKKLGKPLLKAQYFGRKQLFMTSILMGKRKKHKRSGKHLSNSGKLLGDVTLPTDDPGLSTSESCKMADSSFVRFSEKRSRSSSKKGNHVNFVKDIKFCNGGDVHIGDLDSNSKNDSMLSTAEQPRSRLNLTGKRGETDVNTCAKSPLQKGVTSLLMSLTKTTVPRWDDVDMPPSQSHDLDDFQNGNIGYVLDEWDEEYDRGKRKKVKKSGCSFGGPNPFQQIANVELEQNMKARVNQIRTGNQPLRI